MRIYSNKRFQLIITLLYPLLIFLLLSFREEIDTWIVPIGISLVFCFLWKNIRYLMISTLFMWVVTVPLWYFIVEVDKESQFAVLFSSSLPLVVMQFVVIVLVPEVIIISIRNSLIRRFISKG